MAQEARKKGGKPKKKKIKGRQLQDLQKRGKSERWSDMKKVKRQRNGVALRSSKRCLVAMAAPSLQSPWEQLNPVAARLCPWASEGENKRRGGGRRRRKAVTERRV